MLRKILCQSIPTNFVRNYRRKTRDPGIGHRKTAMQDVDKDMNFEDIDVDDFESDLMQVHQSHKEFIREQDIIKEKLKYQIVKQKYFREKHPNFLTWNDKEQIKYLYSTNSNEWSIEKLSESFPALPEVIEKIVKSKYTKNESKMKNHDAAVQRNWNAFKKGELVHLPDKLTQHLKKFSDRSLNFTHFKNPQKIEVIQKPNIPTEFSDIITSYENLIKNEKTQHIKEKNEMYAQNHFSTLNPEMDNGKISEVIERNLTLQELRNEIEQGIVSGKEIPINEKMMFDSLNKNNTGQNVVELKKVELNNLIETTKYQTAGGLVKKAERDLFDNLNKNKKEQNVVELKKEEMNNLMETTKYQTSGGLVKKTEKDFSHLIYPEQILIPKVKFKYGCTYKLNDCYYDSDGRFLYRVPGMG